MSGGIRRAALISLFTADDDLMRSCKTGNWWELNPQRGRANNSAVLLRHKVSESFFSGLWQQIKDSNAGSFSTARACKEIGRDFICFEVEPEYCRTAKNLLNGVSVSLF